MIKYNVKACTGCFACMDACPMNAISFDKNNFFNYPTIDLKKCINCDKCRSVCHIASTSLNKGSFKIKAIGLNSTNDNILQRSSSGGAFTLIAKFFLENNGVVYGASFDNNFTLNHVRIDKYADLYKINGSKYLQSRLDGIFKKVESDLKENTMVLFSGTPCQINALKLFLKKDYGNLLTIDLFCMGVPSPAVFKKYKEFLEKKYKSKIVKYEFRNKDISWQKYKTKVLFENGKVYSKIFYKDKYMELFLSKKIIMKACQNCQFKESFYNSDLTLGDFWNIFDLNRSKFQKLGNSIVLINSQKGDAIINKVIKYMEIQFYPINLNKLLEVNENIKKSLPQVLEFSSIIDTNDNFLKIYSKLKEKNVIKRIKTRIHYLKNISSSFYSFKRKRGKYE